MSKKFWLLHALLLIVGLLLFAAIVTAAFSAIVKLVLVVCLLAVLAPVVINISYADADDIE